MPVYLLRAGSLPIVKIGKADDVAARIAQHQTAHWETLTLLRQWEGGLPEEASLHLRFADMHIRGEWYSFSRTMLGDVGLVEIKVALSPVSEVSRKPTADMDMQTIIAAAGSLAKLGRAVGRSHSTILKWTQVPPAHVPAVAELTKLGRHELRPDLWEAPDTATAA